MKKIIIIILIVVVCILGGNGIYMLNRTNDTNNNKINMEQQNNKPINEDENNNTTNTSKIAVIYFSATGTTEKIAKLISEETNADLIEIEPKEPYTSADLNYNSDCRANQEQNDENARPEIKNKINAGDYDIIYLGYPIWWGDVPKIILTFIDNNNLDGKTVIPFCTSGSTGISRSQNTLKAYHKNMKLLDGKRFSSSASQIEISSWTRELNY